MIVIKYRGGLGNQMFQYAFQIAVQKKYPDTEVMGDLSHYQMHNEHNGFELEQVFGIKVQTTGKKQLKSISPYYVPSKVYEKLPEKLRHLIAHNLQYKYYECNRKNKCDGYFKQEYHNTFEPQVFALSETTDWYLDGLWQDFRYFAEYTDEVKSAFAFNNEDRYSPEDKELLKEIIGTESVGIHVRRGDFVNSKFDICGIDYYRKAISEMKNKLSDSCYFFFTDDPDYVNEYFGDIVNKKIIHHDVQNSIVDMEMLSLCRNVVISNSTFSLWSAWLGKEHMMHVIAPKYSIINKGKKFELIVPENWVQIEV